MSQLKLGNNAPTVIRKLPKFYAISLGDQFSILQFQVSLFFSANFNLFDC